MAAPSDTNPCSIDATNPLDNEPENFGPAWWRYLQLVFIRWTRLQHACDGKHFYGVDSGTANVYVVEVGSASQLLSVGLHAGMFVKFFVSHTNTLTSTLQVKSNATNVGGAVTIKYQGANLTAGVLVLNRIVEVVYDGTNWQLIAGDVPPAPSISRIIALDNDTGNSEVSNTVAETDFTSIALSQVWTKYDINFEIKARNDTGTRRTVIFKLYIGATLLKTYPAITIQQNSTVSIPLNAVADGIAPAALKASCTMSVASTDFGMTLTAFKVFASI